MRAMVFSDGTWRRYVTIIKVINPLDTYLLNNGLRNSVSKFWGLRVSAASLIDHSGRCGFEIEGGGHERLGVVGLRIIEDLR